MTTAKPEVQELLEELPEDTSLDAVILALQQRASVHRGFDELRRGEAMSHEEVKARLTALRASFGRRNRREAILPA